MERAASRRLKNETKLLHIGMFGPQKWGDVDSLIHKNS